jgi:hypothetical protein
MGLVLELMLDLRDVCRAPNRAFWWSRSDIDAADSMVVAAGVLLDGVSVSIRSKSKSTSSSMEESLSSPEA